MNLPHPESDSAGKLSQWMLDLTDVSFLSYYKCFFFLITPHEKNRCRWHCHESWSKFLGSPNILLWPLPILNSLSNPIYSLRPETCQSCVYIKSGDMENVDSCWWSVLNCLSKTMETIAVNQSEHFWQMVTYLTCYTVTFVSSTRQHWCTSQIWSMLCSLSRRIVWWMFIYN